MPSTVIKTIAYDQRDETLYVGFVSGDVYAYAGVPERAYTALRNARSKGRHFGREIRDCYPYRKVVEAERRRRPQAPREGLSASF